MFEIATQTLLKDGVTEVTGVQPNTGAGFAVTCTRASCGDYSFASIYSEAFLISSSALVWPIPACFASSAA